MFLCKARSTMEVSSGTILTIGQNKQKSDLFGIRAKIKVIPPPPPTHTHNYFSFVHVLCLTLRNQNNEEDLSGNSSALEVLYSLYGFASNQCRSITHGGLVLYSQVMGNESTQGQEMVPIPGPVSLF